MQWTALWTVAVWSARTDPLLQVPLQIVEYGVFIVADYGASLADPNRRPCSWHGCRTSMASRLERHGRNRVVLTKLVDVDAVDQVTA